MNLKNLSLKTNITRSLLLFLVLTITASNSNLAEVKKQTSDNEQHLSGDLRSQNGSYNCNPCVNDVVHSINTLANRGQTLGFNWGANYPTVKGAGTKNHWQGIQRLPMMGLDVPYLVVSSSHKNRILTADGRIEYKSLPAHFAVVELGTRGNDGLRLRSNRLQRGRLTRDVIPNPLDRIVKAQKITSEFDHPGGIQAIGKYLLVGTERNIGHTRNTALFTLWDMSNPYYPRPVWAKPKWELKISDSNSVAIVRLADGRYLMVRAMKSATELEFYILDKDLETNPASYHNGVPWDRWEYSELQSEILDSNGKLDRGWADSGNFFGGAGYQNTNLVTECSTGQLYLIFSHGRRPSGLGGWHYIDAYRVDVPVQQPNPKIRGEGVVLTKVATRKMFPGDNSGAIQGDLQAAGGVYVSPNNKLYFYATEHGTVSGDNYVRTIEFGPQEPLSRVHFIDEAWVKLYDKINFSGRSIILDYQDRLLCDYKNFANIERFDNLASSIIYAIPPGYGLRLFSDTQEKGSCVDLIGSGTVIRIEDLNHLVFSDGHGASNRTSSAKWLNMLSIGEKKSPELSPTFGLFQNYPNPFYTETVISYQVAEEAKIIIKIYDFRGQLIRTLVDQKQLAGIYSVKWDGKNNGEKDVASGTYLCRLKMEETVKVRKLTLLR